MFKDLVLLSKNLLQVFYGLKTFCRSYMDIRRFMGRLYPEDHFQVNIFYLLHFLHGYKRFYRSSISGSPFTVARNPFTDLLWPEHLLQLFIV